MQKEGKIPTTYDVDDFTKLTETIQEQLNRYEYLLEINKELSNRLCGMPPTVQEVQAGQPFQNQPVLNTLWQQVNRLVAINDKLATVTSHLERIIG